MMIGRPVSWTEALHIARQVHEEAEEERRRYLEEEAARGIQYVDETSTPHRGYCGIGVERAKTIANLGTLWRSALCLGADFIFTVGDRYHHQCTDTTKAYRHLPYWRFANWDDFHAHVPYDCQVVAVEVLPHAVPLETFAHPERAIYLLGPEDGSLSPQALAICQHIVRINTTVCLNVATAGSIVLYDRRAKFHTERLGAA